ncbi:MAG TPA: SDR family oxidoreductase [Dehalococcoidia bacterium]|nr:SDR family oxidoreductase [Dehalococcoidia bacterium]
MSGKLEGRVAVITGGASGIGRACAERFASEGADIVVADLNADRGAETVVAVESMGQRASFVRTDTSKEADNEALAAAAIETYGTIDVLVAAAGISHSGYVSGEAGDFDRRADPTESYILNRPPEAWEKVMAVNLTGVMLTDRAIARRMIAAGHGGSIVNIASGAAKIPIPGAADYCVSKTGVWMLTKTLALELTGHQIRVNAIGPGMIETPMTVQAHSDEERRRQIENNTPLGRFGQPQDIANAALFLASDESSFTTGQMLHPDGGIFTG